VNAAQPEGSSVLHAAVERRDELLVRLAVRKGADVTAVDAAGRTPRGLAAELGWSPGVALLDGHADLPRDDRSSRFALDANREPVRRADLSDVPQERQSAVTGNSHFNLPKVKELLGADPRLTFSISTDDELAIEACAHIGSRDIIRLHLDHGAPLSLPTAVSLGDLVSVAFWLEREPGLVHERGAHDFPVMWYALLGGGGVEMAELLVHFDVPVDQESMGTTTLHWCARRDDADLARWLLEHGADAEAHGLAWTREPETPLQVARREGSERVAGVLRAAGARR
jgi:ankyrin repeat protein